MSTSRLEQLQNFLDENPRDPFNLYALALEYLSMDLPKAQEYFEILLSQYEDYVPAYYHAAQLYMNLENTEKARTVFEKGIAKSEILGDTHALKELKKAYQQFLWEENL